MNLRMSRSESGSELRFRVTGDEALELLNRSCIDDTISLGSNGRFSYGAFLNDSWELRSSQGNIHLGIPRDHVEKLIRGKVKKDLECRKTLKTGDQNLTVVFAIDAFSQRKDDLNG